MINRESNGNACAAEGSRFAKTLQISDPENLTEELAARYQLLLDNSGFPVVYMDRDGQFLYVTNKSAANLGDAPEKVAGRTVYDYFPSKDADEYVRRLREVIDHDRELTFEDLVTLPDGSRWYWSILHPLKDSSGKILGVQIVSHDITARKAAEAALEERLRFEQLIADLASGFVSLSTTEVANAVNSALRSIGEFMNVDRTLLFRFSGDYQQLDCTHEWHRAELAPARPRLQGNQSSQYPWMFHKLLLGESIVIDDTAGLSGAAQAEGEMLLGHGVQSLISVPIRIRGKTVGAMCFDCLRERRQWSQLMVQRVTLMGQILFSELARVRIENELRESRRLVRAATDASPHVTYILDFAELTCLYISPQVEQELGYTPDEVYAMGAKLITENVHPDELVRLGELLERWVEVHDNQVLETNLRLRHKDGSWRWYACRDRVLTRALEGHVVQTIGTMRDVTEQKQAEEELQSHREKLLHVARLSTMGEMAAGIAHELGQPLYSILNFAKASHNVLEGYDDPRIIETTQWNEHVIKAAARAGDIIRRLRDFARRSAPHREDVDVRSVIDEAVELVSFESRRLSIQIEYDLANESLVVRADRVQLLQILVNLIQNGIEAMGGGGSERRWMMIRASSTDSQVELSVEDRGKGLPDSSTHIFDAFVTTKRDGMGMGLAICKTIAESHGGKLKCESNEYGGATFTVSLPIAQGVESNGS